MINNSTITGEIDTEKVNSANVQKYCF